MMYKDFTLPPVIEDVVDGVVDVDRLDATQRYLLVRAVLGYALRVMDCRVGMKRLLENFVPHRAVIQLGSNVKESYDLLVPVKNLIYRLVQIQETDRKEVIRKFRACGLTKADAQLYFMLHDLDLYDPVLKKMRTAKGEFLPPADVEAKCAAALHELMKRNWIRKNKVVGRMFAFIYSNYPEIDDDDVAQEMLNKASFVFYLEYPFSSTLHLVNKMKRSVENNGKNKLASMMKNAANPRFVNLKKNKRDRHEPDHFVSMESSVYGRDKNGEDHIKVESAFDLNPADEENGNVLRISVAALLQTNTGKRRKVLHLLMQHERRDFVRFVNKRYGQKFTSVEEFHRSVGGGEEWLTAIRLYVKMSRKSFRLFIQSLQKDLVGIL